MILDVFVMEEIYFVKTIVHLLVKMLKLSLVGLLMQNVKVSVLKILILLIVRMLSINLVALQLQIHQKYVNIISKLPHVMK